MTTRANNDKVTILRGMFSPFNAGAWERFREWNIEAAMWLETAVAAGVSLDEIQDYGQGYGYSEGSVNWLLHAAMWLQQIAQGEGPAAAPEPEPQEEPPGQEPEVEPARTEATPRPSRRLTE